MILIRFDLEVIMGRKSGRAALVLTDKQRSRLSELAASRTAAVREVERAGVLLKYAQGLSITEIQRQLGVSRPMIYKCIDKALAAGVQAGLKDAYHRPHAPEITEEAKAWVVSVAVHQTKGVWTGCGVVEHLGAGPPCGRTGSGIGLPTACRCGQEHGLADS